MLRRIDRLPNINLVFSVITAIVISAMAILSLFYFPYRDTKHLRVSALNITLTDVRRTLDEHWQELASSFIPFAHCFLFLSSSNLWIWPRPDENECPTERIAEAGRGGKRADIEVETRRERVDEGLARELRRLLVHEKHVSVVTVN